MISKDEIGRDAIQEFCRLVLNPRYLAWLETTLAGFPPSSKPFDILEELIYRSDDADIPFVAVLDWKADIADLEGSIRYLVKRNFDMEVIIPQSQQFPISYHISYDNVLKKYDEALSKQGFRLGMIRNEIDQCWFFVCKADMYVVCVSHLEKIGDGVEKIVFTQDWEKYEPVVGIDEMEEGIKELLIGMVRVLSRKEDYTIIESLVERTSYRDLISGIDGLSYELEKREIPFILRLERRTLVDMFRTRMEGYIEKRFNICLTPPNSGLFKNRKFITHEGVLMGFEEAFNQSGLTARLLDFGIDYSLFMILHPEEDITRIIAFLENCTPVKVIPIPKDFRDFNMFR